MRKSNFHLAGLSTVFTNRTEFFCFFRSSRVLSVANHYNISKQLTSRELSFLCSEIIEKLQILRISHFPILRDRVRKSQDLIKAVFPVPPSLNSLAGREKALFSPSCSHGSTQAGREEENMQTNGQSLSFLPRPIRIKSAPTTQRIASFFLHEGRGNVSEAISRYLCLSLSPSRTLVS